MSLTDVICLTLYAGSVRITLESIRDDKNISNLYCTPNVNFTLATCTSYRYIGRTLRVYATFPAIVLCNFPSERTFASLRSPQPYIAAVIDATFLPSRISYAHFLRNSKYIYIYIRSPEKR